MTAGRVLAPPAFAVGRPLYAARPAGRVRSGRPGVSVKPLRLGVSAAARRSARPRSPHPTGAAELIDSQCVKADAVVAADCRGFDGGKLINGRKRHVVVDPVGGADPYRPCAVRHSPGTPHGGEGGGMSAISSQNFSAAVGAIGRTLALFGVVWQAWLVCSTGAPGSCCGSRSAEGGPGAESGSGVGFVWAGSFAWSACGAVPAYCCRGRVRRWK